MQNPISLMEDPLVASYAALFFFGISFVFIAMIAWVCNWFLALKSRPPRRALLTAGIPYILVSTLFTIMDTGVLPFWLGPVVPLPAALIVYGWLRYEYGRSWIDDDLVTPDIKIRNTDWRVGLAALAAVLVPAAIKVIFINWGTSTMFRH